MISVYSENINPRLIYILDFFFKEKDQEYQLIKDENEWKKIKEKRINYSNKAIEAEVSISPSQLLFEDDIRSSLELKKDLLIDGKYDEFAIAFYFLCRYEEYLIDDKDSHDRINSKALFAVRLGLHKTPIVDNIVKEIWEKVGVDYQPVLDKFQCVPSFDIDIAWAYKNRGPIRQVGALVKGGDLLKRSKVLIGKEKDPYDTYSYMTEISSKVERIISFVLLGDWSKYDKNINWTNEEYRSLIRGLNTIGGVGIHPSYNSYLNAEKVLEEKDRLEKIVGHPIIKSRQHFMRLIFPETYEILIQNGIERDYSMGFADEIGFRAGTSFPYYHFNLKSNSSTNLLVFPFAYMDSALKDYLILSIEDASAEVEGLIKEVKNVGGIFMCIWHNSSINDIGEWKGWKSILDLTVERALEK